MKRAVSVMTILSCLLATRMACGTGERLQSQIVDADAYREVQKDYERALKEYERAIDEPLPGRTPHDLMRLHLRAADTHLLLFVQELPKDGAVERTASELRRDKGHLDSALRHFKIVSFDTVKPPELHQIYKQTLKRHIAYSCRELANTNCALAGKPDFQDCAADLPRPCEPGGLTAPEGSDGSAKLHAEDGDKAVAAGNYELAISAYRDAYTRDPQSKWLAEIGRDYLQLARQRWNLQDGPDGREMIQQHAQQALSYLDAYRSLRIESNSVDLQVKVLEEEARALLIQANETPNRCEVCRSWKLWLPVAGTVVLGAVLGGTLGGLRPWEPKPIDLTFTYR